MPRFTAKRGFLRLYIVLSCVWAAYCLLVCPIQQYTKAKKVENAEFLSCWQESKADFKGCTEYAKLKVDPDRWVLENYWEREWIVLALFVVGIPLAVYGLILWVWRGFSPNV